MDILTQLELSDGSFSIARLTAAPPQPGFVLVTNWFAELRGRFEAAADTRGR